MFKVRKQLSSTTKAIEYFESSIVAAEVDVDTARRSYYLRWGAEECCKANIEILSTTVEQLKQSQQEASAANKELKAVTALLEDCQTTKEQYHKKLVDLETKLQSTSQLIKEQYTESRTIREKLCSVHIEIPEELCKA
jgi:chromosome segregation ATPase